MKVILAGLALLICMNPVKANVQAQETDTRLNAQGGQWDFYPAENPQSGLPRVLLIGDSVMNGYRADVYELLRGKANVDVWVNPYNQASPGLSSLVHSALANGPYAVIHFNMGLHGWEKGRIPEGQYEPLMRSYLDAIQKDAAGARLVWASTTPVTLKGEPRALDPEINATILEHNRLAAKVVSEAGIPIDDLYSIGVAHLDLAKGDQFHWTPGGYRLMADSVARSILREIEQVQKSHG
jgi:hypothetical protein